MSIEAMKQALEALEHTLNNSIWRDQTFEAITALRQAIKEAEKQEPVACGYDETTGNCTQVNCCYTHPPKREPLTDEEIEGEWERITGHSIIDSYRDKGRTMFLSPSEVFAFARAIEAAHGIKGEA